MHTFPKLAPRTPPKNQVSIPSFPPSGSYLCTSLYEVRRVRVQPPPAADNVSYRTGRPTSVIIPVAVTSAPVTFALAPPSSSRTSTLSDFQPQLFRPNHNHSLDPVSPSPYPLVISCLGHAGRSPSKKTTLDHAFNPRSLIPILPSSIVSNCRQHVEPPTPDRD